MGNFLVGLADAAADAQAAPGARDVGRVVGLILICYMAYRFYKSRRK